MSLKKYYVTLELENGADLAAVKRAYRRMAFTLHPDLNPDLPDAAKQFQRLNEAYVILSQRLSTKPHSAHSASQPDDGGEATTKAREEAHKAYNKAKAGEGATGRASQERHSKEDVVHDLLNDPFARRVFEDIYSHIKHKSEEASTSGPQAPPNRPTPPNGGGNGTPRRNSRPVPQNGPGRAEKVLGKISGWFRKQIDDEQTILLPAESLVPGTRVRLDIQHGIMGKPQTIELTLPPSFEPGKAVRLKGMGKRIGGLKGDLYVKLEAKP